MKKRLRVTVNGQEYEVTVEDMGEEAGDTARPAPSRPQPRPVKDHEPAAEPKTEQVQPEPEQKKEEPVEKPSAGDQGDTEVNAPLAGTIKAINVDVGDAVSSGETIMTLEALKLENEIVAPADGTIATIEVTEGENVENDEVLMTINSA